MTRIRWFLAATLGILLTSCILTNVLNLNTHTIILGMYSRGENGATDDKRPSCLPNNIELCTNKKLYMNLYSNTNAGHIILDDMLNLLLYQPECICNVKEQQTFNGLLEYSPRLISRKCHLFDATNIISWQTVLNINVCYAREFAVLIRSVLMTKTNKELQGK